MIIVFIIGGNEKMQCNTIAENVLWMAETSNGLISMLNGTHHEGTLAPPAMATATATATTSSFVPYRPKVSLLINVIWTTSLTFSLASTVFGIMVRRWAVRYLVNNLHRPIHTRIRHIQSRARKHVDMSPPLALVSRIHLFLPLSVALFYLGLVIFMVHIGISFTLVFVSSFVFTWVMYVFLILTMIPLLTSFVRIYEM